VEKDDEFFDKIVFHVTEEVNKHNIHIWGTENVREVRTYECASKKVIVFTVMSHNKVYEPFFSAELTITVIMHLSMLQNFLIPQLDNEMRPDALFQQDGALPHVLQDIHNFLDNHYPGRWIGHGGHITRPPRRCTTTFPSGCPQLP
jgi:hypothetical protein